MASGGIRVKKGRSSERGVCRRGPEYVGLGDQLRKRVRVQWYKNKKVVLPLLWGLVFLAYARSLGDGFCFDDQGIVVDNPLVSEAQWGAILYSDYWSATGEHTGLYRPLTIASFALNHLVFGGQPWAYHLGNVLLHLGATSLLYLLASVWLAPCGALLAGLCFGLHPAISEAVIFSDRSRS